MSTAPTPAPSGSPFLLDLTEGPQTMGELRAALAAVDPAELAAFSARLDAVRLSSPAALAEVRELVTEFRHVWALHRSEVESAIQAAMAPGARMYTLEELLHQEDQEQGPDA